MGFLVAAVVFMAVSVLIVQRVAQYFGIAVHTNALVLCAVAALIVNFSAILLSAYLTFSHLMMLVILVLFGLSAPGVCRLFRQVLSGTP
ncbi:MAG: hypothetical protein ACSW8H_10870, partial [bacterium]